MGNIWPQTGESLVEIYKVAEHKVIRIEFDKDTNVSDNVLDRAPKGGIPCKNL